MQKMQVQALLGMTLFIVQIASKEKFIIYFKIFRIKINFKLKQIKHSNKNIIYFKIFRSKINFKLKQMEHV